MAMEINFPGGMGVDAHYKGFRIRTDQPHGEGGSAAAPSPFDLFLASIGACAGYYALRFCQERDLPTGGLNLTLYFDRGEDGKKVEGVRFLLRLPAGFPEKYRVAILRSIDQCTVKRHLASPPHFEYSIAAAPAAARTA
jgi:ribosomal protein S12 methylthiotransferase accessory factor